MIPAPLLDTHIWLWWLLGDSRLSFDEARVLDELPPQNRPALSVISLWEIAMLVELGRVQLDISLEEFLQKACSPETVNLIPLNMEVVLEMNTLPSSFHRDPADRLIVSSARVAKRPLSTHDRKICESDLVTIWRP
jgi:PIN domain nuclease of toxin-antitoxin system